VNVPFNDLRAQYHTIKPEIDEAISEILESCAYIGGPALERFEANFASYCGTSEAVGLASGTAALHLAMAALDIGPGDEVITTPYTFIATTEAISQAGATIRFVDCTEEDGCMDPRQVEAAITPRTKAIIPVHLYGQPADMDPMLEIAMRHGVTVIEDAAQAVGAEYGGKRVGSLARIACFSFYPGKNLGALGDAGAVVMDDPDVAAAVRKRRDHGRTDKYLHEEIGVASRLDALQAALLRVKLPHLEACTMRRREVAERYRSHLSSSPAQLVPWEEGAVHHLLCVRVDAERRDDLRGWLSEAGIGNGIHYPVDLSRQPATAPFAPAPCPAASAAAAELVSLPMGPHLTDEQVDQVCAQILAFG
jgi:dTDP-4-amino-4,6-dideoxygalactose transaminase